LCGKQKKSEKTEKSEKTKAYMLAMDGVDFGK